MEQHLTSPTARKAHIFLDPGQWLRLREAYEAGHAVAFLAQTFRISRKTIDVRRQRERWMRRLPDSLVLLEPPPEPPEPASDLEAAARAAIQRAMLAFNVGDTGAARQFATLAALLFRTGRQTQHRAKPAGSAPRVFVPQPSAAGVVAERQAPPHAGQAR